MVTTLTRVTDVDRREASADKWRLLVLAAIGDHSALADTPWSRLKELELFPGVRLGDGPISVPERFMPPGYRLESQRTVDPDGAAKGEAADERLLGHRGESIRRAMLALWLPPIGSRRKKPPKPTTWVFDTTRLLKLASEAIIRFPSADGSVFSHLTADQYQVLLGTVPEANMVRDRHAAVLRRLAAAGRRGILSDFPKSEEGASASAGAFEKERNGTVVPKPTLKGEEGNWQPFPDAFVTALIGRALWLQDNLADQILDCWGRDREIVKMAEVRKGYQPSPKVRAARWANLSDYPWRVDGMPLKELPFDIVFGERRSRHWPPRDPNELGVWVTLLQGLNIHVLAFCTAARRSEIGSATDASLARSKKGDWRFFGRTWKLTRELGGAPRDWPLHPVGVRALEIQTKYARLAGREPGEDYLWVLSGHKYPDKAGARMNMIEAPAVRAARLLGLEELGRSSRTERRGVMLKAMKLPDEALRDEQAHLHRWRHTVGRLVARTVVEAPQVLFDLFGHRNQAMTLRYMISDPEIGEHARRIAREIRAVRAKRALTECLEGKASGPAAARLQEGLRRRVKRRSFYSTGLDEAAEAALVAAGATVGPTSELDVVTREVTGDGSMWDAVRPGVLCTKAMDEFGPCTQGRGTPDPGSCRTTCSHRLERASAREECRADLSRLLAELAEAKAEEAVMVMVNLEGQIRAQMNRWPDVREDFVRSNDNARNIWATMMGAA